MTFKPIYNTQQALGSIQEEMNHLFDRAWHNGLSTPPLDGQSWGPPIDLYEYDDRYVAYVEVPGVDGGTIELTQTDDVLHIRGEKIKPAETETASETHKRERRFGTFCRGLDLPAGADAENISAKCSAGVLEVSIPKIETAKPKAIPIDVQEG
jgi:HSP20 family protein